MEILVQRATLRLCFALHFSFILCCLGSTVGYALDPSKLITQYSHDAWQTERGIPHGTIHDIVRTRDGYLWLATPTGLVRFDGVRFTVFNKQNTSEIRAAAIRVLCEGRDGSLWIGTYGAGLVRYKDGKFTAYSTEAGLSNRMIRALYEDRSGYLWVGTEGGGLNRLQDGKFTAYTTSDGLSKNDVYAICQDHQGNLWVGTYDGLNKFRDGKFTVYTSRDGLTDNNIRALYKDRNGNLWIGTGRGLTQLKENQFRGFTSKDGLSNDYVLSLYQDRDDNLWIGTDGGGLSRFRDNHFAAFNTRDNLSHDSVMSIFEDREGSLWIGTRDGLNRFKDGTFTPFTTNENLPNDFVRTIYEDRRGTLWIGTRGGLFAFNDGKYIKHPTTEGASYDGVWSVGEDRDGNIWSGTRSGLGLVKGEGLVSYTTKQGLSHDSVRAVYGDRDGNLWIGTDGGGLNCYRDNKFSFYTTEHGLSNNVVMTIHQSRDGSFWIGTRDGLNHLTNGKIQVLTNADGSSFGIVRTIHEDTEGTLWFSARAGLIRLKDNQLTAYTVRDGMFDDGLFQILEDERQNLWISCSRGIFRINKSELNEFAAGRTKKVTSIPYDKSDGMKSSECHGNNQPAGWKTRSGKLLFPTIKGMVVVDPDNLRFNQQPPPVMIEQFVVDDRTIDLSTKVRLPPGSGRVEFHYTALSLLAPEKVKFKYKLEGLDREWVDAGARRTAYYTNIAPGNYQFTVIACNNDGVWNETGSSFAFYLAPRFYQTNLFYALCVAIAGLFAWGLYRFRVKGIEARFAAVTAERMAERSRMARELHDTLAQGLGGVGWQLEAAEEIVIEHPHEAKRLLAQARNLVSRSLIETRRSVWDLRPQSLEESDLPSALAEALQQMTSGTLIETRLSVDGVVRPLPSITEKNLLRIGQEAIANAVKHAHAANIDVDLGFELGIVRLSVRDDGCGFNPQDQAATAGNHFGLVGIRERVEQIGGRLSLESSSASGTQIIVEVAIS